MTWRPLRRRRRRVQLRILTEAEAREQLRPLTSSFLHIYPSRVTTTNGSDRHRLK